MKRRAFYSGDTKRAAVAVVTALQRELSEHPHPTIKPFAIASEISGGASERSIRNWMKEDLSQEHINERKSHAGRPRMMSDDQEHILIGYFVHRRTNLLSVNRNVLVQFAAVYINLSIQSQRISEFLQRNNISLQTSRQRGSRRVSLKVVDDAVNFVRDLRAMNYPPDRILIMDQTGLWSNVQNPRTYHFANWFATSTFPKLRFFIILLSLDIFFFPPFLDNLRSILDSLSSHL